MRYGNTRVFKKKSQTHLLKLNPVPLGAGRIPEKTRLIIIPIYTSHNPTLVHRLQSSKQGS